MPFGADCCDPLGVRFQLWAPKAERVDLHLLESGSIKIHTMARVDQGWYELLSEESRPGTRYKFQIDGDLKVPDPASRFQFEDVHGWSEVIDPEAFDWKDGNWRGRPWKEAVFYEAHVGTYTPEGTFRGLVDRLDYLVDLGITALELMPIADFPGERNWGYDGVLLFAPDSQYGRPEDLKQLVQTAHAKGLMAFLDVVYNHFGPDGNYLRTYAPQFFTDRHHTPWGDAINFDGACSRVVRDFFINNALYWLTEYNFDGLRFDAVHAIKDESQKHILDEIAETVRGSIDAVRTVHLVLENDDNAARFLKRESDGRVSGFNAQWNDDIHHAFHVAVTGEEDGYYSDYAERAVEHVGRCLTEGFDFQGQPSAFRGGARRGESSRNLPPSAFISFLQNHDQVGNRAFGERLAQIADPRALRAVVAIVLLAPAPPLVFMGEEFGATTPFLFFCDFKGELAAAVTKGRRNEFARFARFSDPATRERIPDPSSASTYASSKLDWSSLQNPQHQHWLEFYRRLLHLRQREVVPRVIEFEANASFEMIRDTGLVAHWTVLGPSRLSLFANLGDEPIALIQELTGEELFTTESDLNPLRSRKELPGWSVIWLLHEI
jgi:maltooligosyltrehalose trehalohydrolase